MVSRIAVIIIAALVLGSVCGGAWASGEWYWNVSANPATGIRYFSGVAGSMSLLVLQGTVVNNDPQNQLLFNGVTLKTDELTPNDLNLYEALWNVNPSVDFPECLTLDGGEQQSFIIGTFDLSSAPVGIYQFRFIGAAGYDWVAASPSQMNSQLVTIEVLPVPEPGSVISLGAALAGLLVSRRRRGIR